MTGSSSLTELIRDKKDNPSAIVRSTMDAPRYDEVVAVLRSESGDATSVDNITTVIDEIGHFM